MVKKVDKLKGKSKVRGLAAYDQTWNDFQALKERYKLSSDSALRVLLDNWDPLNLDNGIRQELLDNRKGRTKQDDERDGNSKVLFRGFRRDKFEHVSSEQNK